MATDLENMQTRRSAILTELAAGTGSAGQPSYSEGDSSMSHDDHIRRLYDELAALDRLIEAELMRTAGPIEEITYHY